MAVAMVRMYPFMVPPTIKRALNPGVNAGSHRAVRSLSRRWANQWQISKCRQCFGANGRLCCVAGRMGAPTLRNATHHGICQGRARLCGCKRAAKCSLFAAQFQACRD
jgi:hypothetical protein